MVDKKKVNNKLIQIMHGDITLLEVDAFVYNIENNLALGSGTGNAISLRGGPSVQKELDEIAANKGTIPTGQAIISGSGLLPSKYIIHTIGPKFNEEDEDNKLKEATLAALKLAEEKGLKKIAFPPISVGFYAFPAEKCAKIMLDTIEAYLNGNTKIEEIIFCIFDSKHYGIFKDALQ
ncbi:MAG: macro domain-containing protein [Thermodesulfobacteriota bacterium]|nr:macro domain-containing protein [Thermodesulfobacteriota bacterium]